MNNLLNAFSSYSAGGGIMPLILIFIAFAAGVLASLSPCSLGILPLIIGYVGGVSRENNKKLFIQMLFFSAGLSLVLSVTGIICALTGRAFTGFASPVLILLFASFIILLGLNLTGFLDIRFPQLIKKIPENKNGSTFLFPFLIGCIFALASSPCASPILASILALAAVSQNILYSIALLFAFALGQCVIIVFFAMFTSSLKHTGALVKYSEIFIKISGYILIGAGIYICYSILSGIRS